jgi:hypothetical protein
MRFRERIGEAIAEIQACGMKALTPLTVNGLHGAGHVGRDWNDVRLDQGEEFFEFVGKIAPAGNDIHFRQSACRNQNLVRRSQPAEQDLGGRLVQQKGQGRGRIQNNHTGNPSPS